MKRKILAVVLSIVFVLTQTTLVEAKARSFSSGGSRSISKSIGKSSSKSIGGSSSSSKSSGGYSGSSSSRSVPGSYSSGSSSSSKSSGYSGSSSSSSGSSGSAGSNSSSSKSSGYSGSSSSSSGSSGSAGSGSSSSKSSGYSGSSSSSSSKSTSSPIKSKTDTLKTSYMQDAYKKEVSQSNYSKYKQTLNNDQKKVYESSFNNTYGSGSRMDFDYAMRTRPQRISAYSTRPIRVSINTYHFGSPFSYGYAYVGPWDLWFLMRASDMFWYHHWNDIHPYRDYFEAAQFAEMEKRIQQLEAQNIARDSSYLDPDVDPDLQLSSDYQEQNVDRIYYTNKYAEPVKNPFQTLLVILILLFILILIIRLLSRRRPQRPYRGGGIY